MGDLEQDTAVEGAAGRYTAKVVPDWDVWVPNGGYLSALALRAAAAETDLPRPISYHCHYLQPARSGQSVSVEVVTGRRTSRSHSLRVTLRQEHGTILEAMVWAADPPSPLGYDLARMPEVPPPDALRTNEEIHDPDPAPFPFWQNVEGRPVTWTGRWDERPALDPLWRGWYRFRPRDVFDDPFVDAGRALVLIDTMLYPAAALREDGSAPPFLAPSMDLNVRFHHPGSDSAWLLSSTEAPTAVAGIIGGYAAVWTRDGRLVATGGQQMFHLGDAPT